VKGHENTKMLHVAFLHLLTSLIVNSVTVSSISYQTRVVQCLTLINKLSDNNCYIDNVKMIVVGGYCY